MKTIKNRNRKVGGRKLPKARKARKRRKAALAKSLRPAVRAVALDCVRGKGPPVRNVKGSLAVIMPGERKALWGNRCCLKCLRPRLASMSVTWEYWSRGAWRSTRRYFCDRHGNKLKARLGRHK
jgi:hypothetical protein